MDGIICFLKLKGCLKNSEDLSSLLIPVWMMTVFPLSPDLYAYSSLLEASTSAHQWELSIGQCISIEEMKFVSA